uniref:Uncharacterized protein n=3 Tax=Oryza TaxID=4527 RepID=A0A5S6RA29_ORYSJ|nr:hypothetical protein [Oryza sativa Japonica Group]AAP54622.1 hypothetical protein LOC_Os10g37220 [Oryza sativa Japonica Group]
MELRVFAPSISAATRLEAGGRRRHPPAAEKTIGLRRRYLSFAPQSSAATRSSSAVRMPQLHSSRFQGLRNSSNSSDSNHSQAGTNVLIHSGCAFCDPYGILQRIQYSAYSQDMCTCITVGSKQQTQRFSTQLLTTDTNCCWFQASEFRETRYFAFRSQVHNMLRKALINGINCSAIHPA